MGYAGGELAQPTYHNLGEHTEAVEVSFDPGLISYQELLEVYWGSFPATLPSGPSRARTAVFARNDSQLVIAEASKRQLRRRLGEKITTEVVPGTAFWPAERMHQKFHLQRVYPELVGELAEAFADVDTFLASTAAARINAFVSGSADLADLEQAAAALGWETEDLVSRLDPVKTASDARGSETSFE